MEKNGIKTFADAGLACEDPFPLQLMGCAQTNTATSYLEFILSLSLHRPPWELPG